MVWKLQLIIRMGVFNREDYTHDWITGKEAKLWLQKVKRMKCQDCGQKPKSDPTYGSWSNRKKDPKNREYRLFECYCAKKYRGDFARSWQEYLAIRPLLFPLQS